MKINNKIGVIEIAVMLYVLIAFIGGAVLWKPATSLLGIGTQGQKVQKSYYKRAESVPMFWVDEKGKQHPMAPLTRMEESSQAMTEEPKMTLWQRLRALGIWGIILCIAFPGTIGAWAIKIYFKGKENIKQLVIGIEKARKELPAESMKILETNLSKKADTTTKTLVKKIKANLKQDDVV